MNRLHLRWPVLVRLTAICVVLIFIGALTGLAQSTSSGTITGTATDPSGAVIPNAVIAVADLTTKVERTTLTNKVGLYVLPNIPPGNYSLSATKSGFSKEEIALLTVSVGTQTNANFTMKIG